MGKTKNVLESPFTEEFKNVRGVNFFFGKEGSYNSTLEISNPILQFSGDKNAYYIYINTFNNIIKILGEDYLIQKQDIFFISKFKGKKDDDFLQQSYMNFFEGREYKNIKTYLTISFAPKGKMKKFSEKDFKDFVNKVNKVYELLVEKKFLPIHCTVSEILQFRKNYLSCSFNDDNIFLDNFKINEETLEIRGKVFKTIPFVDIDEINFPPGITPYSSEDIGYDFPTDTLSFLASRIKVDTLIYNQVFQVPRQQAQITALEKKRKRHESMPDPENGIAVDDINSVLKYIAQSNDLLTNCHFSVQLFGEETEIETATNLLEQELFTLGITPSKQLYNQFELYRSAIPGNAIALPDYELFLTTLEPCLCLLFKENIARNETEDGFKVYFADRAGIPVAIDTSDIPMDTNRISNRNKFVLGPSGSGKSFFMNHLVRQYVQFNTDIVLVDTGNSYEGICSYYGGEYITYTKEKPITMNPFKIEFKEYNEEKIQFIISLVSLCWKGANTEATQIETGVIQDTVFAYFEEYFLAFDEGLKTMDYLSFTSFYEFSLVFIDELTKKEGIKFKLSSYKFLLKQFAKGGSYESLLNSDMEGSLFDASFIVFEIDEIKEHKILFPIVTIIIMDVFLQKMRLKNNRKALIVEEAWKAIASPNMAGYLLYLYKTVRKFYGEAVVVTQELKDIISNEIVKDSILANSDTLMLLDQSKFIDKYDEIAQLLSLNEVEKNKIFTVNKLDNKEGRNRFKEVYIKRGSSGEVYGVEVSNEEYLTYTTELRDKLAVKLYKKLYSNIHSEAITLFVSDFKSSKLKLPKFCSTINEDGEASFEVYRIKTNSKNNSEFLERFILDLKDSKMSIPDFFKHIIKTKELYAYIKQEISKAV